MGSNKLFYVADMDSWSGKYFPKFLGRAPAPRIDVWRPMVRNVLCRFGEFCTVVEPVLCTAQRLNKSKILFLLCVRPRCHQNTKTDIGA